MVSNVLDLRRFRNPISPLDDNKTKIAKSGALVPLTRLARSKDMRVQRNATGALLNMTHSGEILLVACFNSVIHIRHRREPTATRQRWSHPCPCQPAQLP
jgi:homogentisate 1,2-dioxygenase